MPQRSLACFWLVYAATSGYLLHDGIEDRHVVLIWLASPMCFAWLYVTVVVACPLLVHFRAWGLFAIGLSIFAMNIYVCTQYPKEFWVYALLLITGIPALVLSSCSVCFAYCPDDSNEEVSVEEGPDDDGSQA